MKRKIMLGAWAAVAAASLSLAAAGTAVATEAAPKPCGYSESDGHAWYNHCTNDGSWIWIQLDVVFGPDGPMCVQPGLNDIGASSGYRGAYYTGDLCAHGFSPTNDDER